ncbi:hypothetical protein ABZ215_34155 [Amycolatopsis sp. NPDC006131]
MTAPPAVYSPHALFEPALAARRLKPRPACAGRALVTVSRP